MAGRVVLHASSTKAFLWALGCAGLFALSLVFYLVSPAQNSVCIVGVLLFSLAALMYLYWTFTSSPLVTVDASELVYQPYPFLKRSIRWADVEGVVATKSEYYRVLNVWFAIRPHAQSAYRGKSQVRLIFSPYLLPVSYDEFVALLRRYHEVSYTR